MTQITEFDYQAGRYVLVQHGTEQFFYNIQDEGAFSAKLRDLHFRDLTTALFTGVREDYGVEVFTNDAVAQQYLLVHRFLGDTVYVVRVHDFASLMHLMHEASTIILASLHPREE